MKYLIAVSAFCGLLVLQVLAQQTPTLPDPPSPPEAYPGQLQHAQPPEGFTCERQNIDLSIPPEHACTCERMYSPDDGHVMEDQHCTVFWPCVCVPLRDWRQADGGTTMRLLPRDWRWRVLGLCVIVCVKIAWWSSEIALLKEKWQKRRRVL